MEGCHADTARGSCQLRPDRGSGRVAGQCPVGRQGTARSARGFSASLASRDQRSTANLFSIRHARIHQTKSVADRRRHQILRSHCQSGTPVATRSGAAAVGARRVIQAAIRAPLYNRLPPHSKYSPYPAPLSQYAGATTPPVSPGGNPESFRPRCAAWYSAVLFFYFGVQ